MERAAYDFGALGGLAVCVCTYGSETWESWGNTALGTAEAAVEALGAQGVRLIRVHADGDSTVARVRNQGLEQAAESGAEWITYLDGDDELTQAWFAAMYKVMIGTRGGEARVFYPAVRTRRMDARGRLSGWSRSFLPEVWGHTMSRVHEGSACTADCLDMSNWLVVGSVARVSDMTEAGGWLEEPVFEDWSMWLRIRALVPEGERAGAIVPVERAVYRITLRPGSRNNADAEVVSRVRRELMSKYVSRRRSTL